MGSNEIQYDDKGNPGHWVYSHRSETPIFVREGETIDQAFLRRRADKESQEQLFQIRKNLEQASEQGYEFSYRENHVFKQTAQAVYREISKLKSSVGIDPNDPEAMIKAAATLISEHTDFKGSREPACYRTAGAIAAMLDKLGITDYKCFMGILCHSAEEAEVVRDPNHSNHLWIEWNGNIYETFPGQDLRDLKFRVSNIELFFYL